jgi:hypothetical protein
LHKLSQHEPDTREAGEGERLAIEIFPALGECDSGQAKRRFFRRFCCFEPRLQSVHQWFRLRSRTARRCSASKTADSPLNRVDDCNALDELGFERRANVIDHAVEGLRCELASTVSGFIYTISQ